MLGTKMRMQSPKTSSPESGEVKGELYTWGRNQSGQLGNGTNDGVLISTQVGEENDWSVVSAGELHSLAIRNGEVYSWGTNTGGITGLGLNEDSEVRTPRKIDRLTSCTHVAAGTRHSLVISEGKLFAFGGSENYQTGLGVMDTIVVPTQVGTFEDWELAATGNHHSIGLRSGRLYAWGSNAYGSTGRGIDTGYTIEPIEIGLGFSDWTYISAGENTGFAIRSGLLYSWGYNDRGKTGQNINMGNTLVPTQVGVGTEYEHGWTKVSGGKSHVLGLRDGKLYAWGNNVHGRTGLGLGNGNTLAPTQVGEFSDWEDIAAGVSCSLAIRNGELYVWGNNAYGATGLGRANGYEDMPIRVDSQTGWKSVSVAFHSMAIKEA